MRIASLSLIVAGFVACAAPALAQVGPKGVLTATQACPATTAIKSRQQDVTLSVGATYAVVGRNSYDASHYYVEIPGAAPKRRWVSVACGAFTIGGALPTPAPVPPPAPVPTPAPTPTPNPTPVVDRTGPNPDDMLLALSWQPAFCESKKDAKPECKTLTQQSYVADHFALHGLWPQADRATGKVCSGSPSKARACECPPQASGVSLSPDLQGKLGQIMPGWSFGFALYEWNKHGVCYSEAGQEAYFADAVALVKQLNESAVQKLFADKLGDTLTAQEVVKAFDMAFGPGAGQRVRLNCAKSPKTGQPMIVDIFVNVTGKVEPTTKLADLIHAAPPAKLNEKCLAGVVDRADR